MAKRNANKATDLVITAAEGYVVGLEMYANTAAEPAPKVRKKHVIKDRSKVDSPVVKVWDICASMPAAARKVQIEACLAAGIALNTARTQSSLWAKAEKAAAEPVAA